MDNKGLLWGRKAQATWFAAACSLFLTVCCPLWIFFNWIALEYFDGSLIYAFSVLVHDGFITFCSQYLPQLSIEAMFGYAGWVLFQAALYTLLPAPISTGQLTPAGNLLRYKTNGLSAWALTHFIVITAAISGYLDLSILANHWQGLLVASNAYGFLLSAFCLIKGYIAPSYPGDSKFSGSLIFDFFVGIELNPRFGELWDLKLFHNGRPGIIAWTLIDISYAAAQYQKLGHVTNSMWLVCLFDFIYVVDFFVNEDWYLRTFDITHDHYGFMLGWGSVALVPTLYTIKAQYLSRYPVDLPPSNALLILSIGLGGYAIFRFANHEKYIVRSKNGRCNVWGKPADYIKAPYKTEDGQTHESLLLCSGWWGFARHANYLGDLTLALAMGLACGLTDLLPWSYTFFIAAILANRVPRDEARCSQKYGKNWQTYCAKVRWRLIPGII